MPAARKSAMKDPMWTRPVVFLLGVAVAVLAACPKERSLDDAGEVLPDDGGQELVDSGAQGAGDDAGNDGGADSGTPVDAGSFRCPDAGCSLTCDPLDTWEVLNASGAGIATIRNLGDVDPATPDEVGDGRYHLYAGVAHEHVVGANSWGVVYIHDAVAWDAGGPYSITSTPVVAQRDSYDFFGLEVPTYVRYDAHTEYLYYCGIYISYSSDAGAKGQISALKRVDGGPWQKLGPVAPFSQGSISQCEPDATLDPATGLVTLMFIADGPGDNIKVRQSANPELFPAAGETSYGKYYTRIGTSFDPYSEVWRYSLDIGGYPRPLWTAQSYSRTFPPDDATLQANGEMLHLGTHDLHPQIHSNGPFVNQTTGAFYPSPDEVLFFYTGEKGASVDMRVYAQRCRRQ